ncbi:MAG: GNAT family N-acetyltransferase [Pyrinomonadaceae bacterium]
MAVTIRRARPDDANPVAEFAMKLVEQHIGYDPVRFARIATLEGMAWFYGGQTDSENAAVLVAEIDNRIVGFAYVVYEEKNYAELAVSVAHLHDIYVEEDARNSGTGQGLIEAAVDFAKERGASKLMLSVAAKNSAARSFFKRAGFETTMHEMMLVVGEMRSDDREQFT